MLVRLLRQAFKNPGARADVSAGAALLTVPEAAPPEQTGQNLIRLIGHCSGLVTDSLGQESQQRMQMRAALIDQIAGAGSAPLNVFVFHVDMGEASRISYRDIKMDASRFDYVAVLQAFVDSVRRWHPEARILLFTNRGSAMTRMRGPATVVEMDFANDQPMYERVSAMCAYVHSRAFDADTLFLDSDAFLNARVDEVWRSDFDVGLTFRTDPGLMPVNEGVILARAARKSAVQRFFTKYLGTYDALRVDPIVNRFYGDVRKWRGGQLSLNSVTWDAYPYSTHRDMSIDGVVLKALPCDPFNYSFDERKGVDARELPSKVIVHLKGGRKDHLSAWRRYVGAEAGAQVPASSGSPSAPQWSLPDPGRQHGRGIGEPLSPDRKYSLDTTPPIDYEPAFDIDYRTATLTELADHYKTDKGSIKHRYTEVYERYFAPLRDKSVAVLEIGVACGSSLKTWARYFPLGKIVGVDIREECRSLCKAYSNIEIVIGDAAELRSDRDLDIVIDDGSHVSLDIVRAFENLWPRVRPGGYFVIEDLRCTHDPQYQRSFVFPKAAEAFDRGHFVRFLDAKLREMDYGQSDIDFVHMYRQMAVIRKRA